MKAVETNPVILADAIDVPLLSTGSQLIHQLKSPTGLTLLGCLVAVVAFQVMGGGTKKGKIATSYWGGGKEKTRAAVLAKKQITAVSHNNVALYIGTPSFVHKHLVD